MQPDERGIPVSQAAKMLGISPAAARKRVRRGTLRAYKVDGEWMVVLPQSAQDTGTTVAVGQGYDAGTGTVRLEDLRDRVRFLEGVIGELVRRLPEPGQEAIAQSARADMPPAGDLVPPRTLTTAARPDDLVPVPSPARRETEPSPNVERPTTAPAEPPVRLVVRRAWWQRLLGR